LIYVVCVQCYLCDFYCISFSWVRSYWY